MADVVDAATRSRMMSGIRGRDTQPERVLRSALFARGLRFRLHRRDLPGRPDLVLSRYRAVIFVHGCFWHRHPGCRFSTRPATNVRFWSDKLAANVARDASRLDELRALGWRVAVVWECELRAGSESVADRLTSWLRDPAMPSEVPAEPMTAGFR